MAKEKMMQRTECITVITYQKAGCEPVTIEVPGKVSEDYEILAAACKDAKEVVNVTGYEVKTTVYKMPVAKFKELAEKQIVTGETVKE